MNRIKANLPLNEQAYRDGTGEGVWFIVNDKTKAAHDADASGARYYGILMHNSVYYPEFKPGELLPLEMRGDKRPVVPYEALQIRNKLYYTRADGRDMAVAVIDGRAYYNTFIGKHEDPVTFLQELAEIDLNEIVYTWDRDLLEDILVDGVEILAEANLKSQQKAD